MLSLLYSSNFSMNLNVLQEQSWVGFVDMNQLGTDLKTKLKVVSFVSII
jgi:hypothetical protein